MRRDRQPFEVLTRKQRRQLVIASALRTVGTAGVLVALYYMVPFDHDVSPAMVAGVVLGGAVLAVVIALQVRTVARSSNPGIRAVEALAFTLPVFVLLFATTYVVMADTTPSTFTEPLSRTDALYFTVTTLATVGYGDIAPESQGARLVVTAQIILDLLLVGLVLHLFTEAVKRARQREAASRAGEGDDTGAAAGGGP
jgi:hypothetical protein